MDGNDSLKILVPAAAFAVGVSLLLYFWPRRCDPAQVVGELLHSLEVELSLGPGKRVNIFDYN